MVNLEIARGRLYNQHITRQEIETLQALVEWLGAVQAQDFAGAKWAPGLRLHGATDNDVGRAFSEGGHPAHPYHAPHLAFRLTRRYSLAA